MCLYTGVERVVGFDELAAFLLSRGVYGTVIAFMVAWVLVWFIRRLWRVFRKRLGQPLHLPRDREGEPITMTRPDTEDWILLSLPDITLKAGSSVILHEGEKHLITDIRQDFNPGGHYTYVKLTPFPGEPKPEPPEPKTRYERMLKDDDWD